LRTDAEPLQQDIYFNGIWTNPNKCIVCVKKDPGTKIVPGTSR